MINWPIDVQPTMRGLTKAISVPLTVSLHFQTKRAHAHPKGKTTQAIQPTKLLFCYVTIKDDVVDGDSQRRVMIYSMFLEFFRVKRENAGGGSEHDTLTWF